MTLEFIGRNLYLQPTPAGAYAAVAGPEANPERTLLQALMRGEVSVRPSVTDIAWWCSQSEQDALATVYRAQEKGWIEGFTSPQSPPSGQLEPIATRAVEALSTTGQGLLADSQGFCMASTGFDATAAEFLAAVSADIASMHERHSAYLADASGSSTSAWALVDMAGNSKVGFWPLFVGENRFVIALGGLPALQHPAMVELVWSLVNRYGRTED